MRVSEIRVNQIRVNQGLGVLGIQNSEIWLFDDVSKINAGYFQQTLYSQKFVEITSNVLPSHLKQTFPPII